MIFILSPMGRTFLYLVDINRLNKKKIDNMFDSC
jgi:hypothetical protein